MRTISGPLSGGTGRPGVKVRTGVPSRSGSGRCASGRAERAGGPRRKGHLVLVPTAEAVPGSLGPGLRRPTRPIGTEGAGAGQIGTRPSGSRPPRTGPATSVPAAGRLVPARGSTAGPLRLTRRGLWVLRCGVAGISAVTVLVVLVLSGHSAAAGTHGRPLPVRSHVVMPGETLWGIARQVNPNADPRDVIAEIISLNGLDGAGLRVGQEIALPDRS